jgi:hypothetical protein
VTCEIDRGVCPGRLSDMNTSFVRRPPAARGRQHQVGKVLKKTRGFPSARVARTLNAIWRTPRRRQSSSITLRLRPACHRDDANRSQQPRNADTARLHRDGIRDPLTAGQRRSAGQ